MFSTVCDFYINRSRQDLPRFRGYDNALEEVGIAVDSILESRSNIQMEQIIWIRTINNYLKGYFSEEIAIQLLLPQKLKDQYVFKTERALAVLEFLEAKQV